MAKKAQAAPGVAKAGRTVDVILENADDAGIYVNFAEVGRTPHDFAISFGRLPAKPSIGQVTVTKDAAELHLPVVVQVIFPPSIMEGLILALTDQLRKYRAEFGTQPTVEASKARRST
jgi:hypothetical protein